MMGAQAEEGTGREAALATFEQKYQEFLAVFAAAPDEALPYVPAGDEYALGVLPLHLQHPLRDYMDLLRRMLRADFAQIDLGADAARTATQKQRHAKLISWRPTAADRPGLLSGLESAHQDARAQLGALDEAAFCCSAPVIYSPGAAPYPTSARDIIGWLIDHYQEHIVQVQDMLKGWPGA